MHDLTRIAMIIGFLGLTLGAFAQQGDINSPFSRFGIGDLYSEAPMHARQMGGLGTAFIETFHLNFDNPASLSHLQRTAFNVGMDFQRSQISDAEASATNWSGNLGYLGLGFPLKNPVNELFSREKSKFTLGMGFALMPHSTTSYNIVSSEESPEVGTFNRIFSGNGGTYKAMWSNSIKHGNFSFGANLGVILGQIEYERIITFPDELSAYINEFSNSYRIRGLYSKLGALYLHTFNKAAVAEGNESAKLLSLGLTYTPNVSANTTSDISLINYFGPGGTPDINPLTDTLSASIGERGNATLPSEVAFGMMYYSGTKYAVGMDFSRTFWSNYQNDANPESLEDTYRIAVGGYYRPNANDLNKFLNRVSYRFGVYYEQDPRLINMKRITTYGITTGFGMPLAWQRKFSSLDLGFDVGKRSVDGILSETFAKITFGFTFNESDWFVKRKFN